MSEGLSVQYHLEKMRIAIDRLREGEAPSEDLLGSIWQAAQMLAHSASTGRAGPAAAEENAARWTHGTVVKAYDAGHDVVSGAGRKIEVKFSKLNRPNATRGLLRWNWTNILGNVSRRQKDYDMILLIGDVDPKNVEGFSIVDGRFVVFGIPKEYILGSRAEIRLSEAARGTIALSTDPSLPHTRSMIERFGLTGAELALL